MDELLLSLQTHIDRCTLNQWVRAPKSLTFKRTSPIAFDMLMCKAWISSAVRELFSKSLKNSIITSLYHGGASSFVSFNVSELHYSRNEKTLHYQSNQRIDWKNQQHFNTWNCKTDIVDVRQLLAWSKEHSFYLLSNVKYLVRSWDRTLERSLAGRELGHQLGRQLGWQLGWQLGRQLSQETCRDNDLRRTCRIIYNRQQIQTI